MPVAATAIAPVSAKSRLDRALSLVADVRGGEGLTSLLMLLNILLLLVCYSVIKTVREPLVVLDQKLNILSANPAFYRLFRVTPDETVGERIHDLGNRQWDIAPLRKLLTDVLLRHNSFENFVVVHDFPKIGRKKMMLNGRVLEHETDKLILLPLKRWRPDINENER